MSFRTTLTKKDRKRQVIQQCIDYDMALLRNKSVLIEDAKRGLREIEENRHKFDKSWYDNKKMEILGLLRTYENIPLEVEMSIREGRRRLRELDS